MKRLILAVFLVFSFPALGEDEDGFDLFQLPKLSEEQKPILNGLAIGVKLSTDLKNKFNFQEYEVDVHLVKLLLLGGFELESNFLIEGLKEVRKTKLEGVLSKKLHKNVSVGFAVGSDLKSIKNLEHSLSILFHDFYRVDDKNFIGSVTVDTKKRKFMGYSVGVKFDSGYEFGVGVTNYKTLFLLARVSLL